ncbi:unnamed protein product (mitochondrion) [Plasmodiophora brassicae]|uniref:FH2 domain-containing protein n=1 Tax=Plasmodiophora brassicae TaxID=37360 RepID=A0A3P3YJI2_PLABS|nr:unnamed protein product [Plasmodiophora brassicae]
MAFCLTVRHGDRSVEMAVDRDRNLDRITSDAIAQLDAGSAGSTEVFALQDAQSKAFVASSADLPVGGGTFDLTNISDLCLKAIGELNDIKDRAADLKNDVATAVKRAVFQLECDLKFDLFGEEFISQGGMDPLVAVVESFEGNAQAYALKALARALCYLNGLEYMKSNPELMEGLLNLTYELKNITAARQALALMFVVCDFVDDGFDLVHKAAKRTARNKRVKPYAQIIRLLASGDLDAQINSLTLVNVLLRKAPDKAMRKKLVLMLDAVGLCDVLEQQQDRIGHADYVTQVELFQTLSGQVCTASMFQIEALKRTIANLQQEAEAARQEVSQLEGQRKFINIIRDELLRYRAVVKDAYDQGALVAANAPVHRQGEQTAFETALAPVVELAQELERFANSSAIIARNEEQVASLQKRVTELTSQLDATQGNAAMVANLQAELEQLKASGAVASTGGPPAPDASAAPPAAPPAPGCPPPPPAPPAPGCPAPPPPPPPPGCPAPPPPPGAPAIGPPRPMGPQPTKPVIKPKHKMRALHWKRIIIDPSDKESGQATSSLWSSLRLPSLDFDDFADHFGQNVSQNAASALKQAKNPTVKKNAKIRVLSAKRSNAVAIMISQLPEFSVIKTAIIQMDQKALTVDMVDAILGHLPTKEELDEIKNVPDASKLEKPETYLLVMSSIPHLTERLRCWLFALSFGDQVKTASRPLEEVIEACTTLRSSDNLKQVLAAILSFGNYMNGGTNRGQADAFNLDVLNRLENSKSANSSTNLLQYIAKVCHTARPGVRSLLSDLEKSVGAASTNGNLNELESKVTSLAAAMKKVKADAELVTKCGPGDKFQSRMADFFDASASDLKALEALRKKAVDAYNGTVSYFLANKDFDATSSSSFFGTFVTFARRFNGALPQEPKRRRSNTAVRKHAVGEKIGDGNMNDVIASLRKGHDNKAKKAIAGMRMLPMEKRT